MNNKITTVEELNQMVTGLYNLLEKKEAEIRDFGVQIDSYLLSEIDNRRRSIETFTEGAARVDRSVFTKSEIISDFTIAAELIRKDIAAIGSKR